MPCAESNANGEEVPTPNLPPKYAFPVVVAGPLTVRPSRPSPTVEEAYAVRPPLNCVRVEVAFPASGKAYAPPLPDPQAVPVFERSPDEENVAHPGAPPAEDTMRLVVDAIVVETTVEVANVSSVFPTSVVEASMLANVELNRLEMVVEPATASEVEVAPVVVRPPLNAICVVVEFDGKG